MQRVVGTGRIYQLNVSHGGVPKRPIEQGVVTSVGIEGDAHRDLRAHGGPERALCFYALEQIQRLQAEGHPVTPGSMGENVTTEGIDLSQVKPGDRLWLGDEVLVEVTRYTTPCVNIIGSFKDGDFSRVLQTKHPGWSRFYTRVLQVGLIRQGDTVQHLAAETPQD